MVRRLSRKTFLSRLLTACLVVIFTTSFTGIGGATPVRAGSQDTTQTVDAVTPQPEVEAPQADADAPAEEDESAEAPPEEQADPAPQESAPEQDAGGVTAAASPERTRVQTLDKATIGAASLVAPVLVSGNPPLEPGGMRIDPPTAGTHGPVTISFRTTALGQVMDFTSTRPVSKVVVKGGPNANVYSYPSPVSADTGLHAPLNDGTSGAAIQPACHYLGISHVDFYFSSEPPDLSVSKTVDFDGDGIFGDSETNYVGEQATWKIVVSNGSDAGPAYNVTIDDTNGQSFGPVDLEAGQSETFTYTTTVTQDTLNVATATGLDADEDEIEPVSDDASAHVVGRPGLSVAKTVDFNGDGVFSEAETYYAGATARWRIVVTNTGADDLLGVVVTDSNGRSFGPIDLAAGASQPFEYDETVDSDTVNTATADGVDQLGTPVTATPDDAIADTITPGFTVKKYVDFDGDGVYSDDIEFNYVGETASWQIVLTNTGDVPMLIGYGDSGGQTGLVLVGVGQSEIITYESTVFFDTLNVVGAVGIDPLEVQSDPQYDTAEARVSNYADLHIDKTVDFDGDGVFSDSEVGYAGETATWKIVVSNGPEAGPVYGVTVTDTNGQSFGPFDLAPGQSETFTYTATVDDDTLNTATASGYDGLENPAGPVSDVAAAHAINPALSVDKTVDFDGDGVFSDSETYYSGAQATWKIVLTNTGDSTLYGAMVTDTNGRTFGPIDLAPGASETFTYTETVNADRVNVAGAIAYDELQQTVEADADEASVDVIAPGLLVKKYVDFDGDGVYSDEFETNYAGQSASWLLVFVNTGDVPMFVGYADVNGQTGTLFLEPGQTEVVPYDSVVTVDTLNVVGAVGGDPLGGQTEPQFDDAEARVVQRADLHIDKTVDFDGDGTFGDSETYYVGETATWKIVVSNGPEAGPVYGVTVTDTNGQSFGPVDLAPGQSETFTYSTAVTEDTLNSATADGFDELEQPIEPVSDSALADTIAPALTVDKTVDFDGDGVFSDSETYYAGASATWKIVVTNSGDCDVYGISVTDSNGQSFGPVDLAAGASETYTYTTTVNEDTVNTATASGSDQFEETVDAESDEAIVDAISPGFTVKKYVDFDGDGVYSDDLEANYAGETAAWQLVFTNTGDVPMVVTYLDSNGQSGVVTLDAGASETVTYYGPAYFDEINTVWATGIDPLGTPSQEQYDTAAVEVTYPSDLRIEKTVDFDGDGTFGDLETNYAGEDATWMIVVSNGPEAGPVYGVTITDSNGQTFGPFDLAADESVGVTYSTSPDEDTVNTATATGFDALEEEVGPVNDDAAVDTLSPELTVDKTVDFDGDGVFSDSETYYAGATATWKITVTNSGDCDVFGISVTDSNGQTFGPVDLAAGASATYVYAETIETDTVNTASVSGYDQFEHAVESTSDEAIVDAISPGFTVKKYVDFDGDGVYSDDLEANYAGETAAWQLVFTNTGDVPMVVTYLDSNGQSGVVTLDAGASETVTYYGPAYFDEINTVWATGIDPLGTPSQEQYDTAAVEVTYPSDLRIEKTVDFDGDGTFGDLETWYEGEEATWTITVTNGYGDQGELYLSSIPAGALYGVMVTDSNGQSWGPFDLAGGESRTFTYTEIIDAEKTNVATVSGYDELENEVGPVSDDAAVDPINPSISVVESCDAPPEGVPTGSSVEYQFLVTNGPEPLTDVRLVDGVLGVDEPLGDLAPGETVEYSTDVVLNNPTADTVEVSGLDQFERVVTDDDGLFVDIFSPYTETDVGIQKIADQETVDGGAVVTYTLVYTNNGTTPVQGFTIMDDYDERYSEVEDAAGGVVSNGTITWTVDDVLQPGQSGSIAYQLLISDDLPVGTTQIDNVVFITADGDSDPSNNSASRQVGVAYLPYTEDDDGEPWLPFTGGNAALIALVAAAAAGAGTIMRRRSRRTS